MDRDTIELAGLRLSAQLGVPEDERRQWQTLVVDVRLEPEGGFRCPGDALAETVDYGEVAVLLRAVAASRPRHLLETLAEDLVAALLARFPVSRVALDLKKFILPGCDYVAVRLSRSRQEA